MVLALGFLPPGSELYLPKSNQEAIGSIKVIPRNRAERVTRKNTLFFLAYILLNLALLIDRLYVPCIISILSLTYAILHPYVYENHSL